MTTTEDLILRLSAEPAPQPLRTGRLALAIVASVVVPVLLFLLVFGTRPDLIQAWSNSVVPFKTVLPLITSALSLLLLLRLTRPGAQAGRIVWAYAVPIGAALALWLGAFALRAPPEGFNDIGVISLAECLGIILLLAAVPAVVALRVIRLGASTSPILSGALCGLTTASGVAAGYSLFCTRDNPLFFVTWYGAAILIATLISAYIGRRTLRW